MRDEVFQSLKQKVDKKTFYNNWKGFSEIMYWLSWIGNILSIVFAYFFVYDKINTVVLEPTPTTNIIVIGFTLLILVSLEVMKRFLFDKFFLGFIKDKYKFKEAQTKILLFTCIGLITASFYFSLNGAKEFADKRKDLDKQNIEMVDNFSDSLNIVYNNKFAKLDTMSMKLYAKNDKYDNTIEEYENKILAYSNDSWQDRQAKQRDIKMVDKKTKEKENNIALIEKNEKKIKDLKIEKEKEISKYSKRKETESSKVLEETKDSPMLFLCFSSIIEVFIIFGIFFMNYFDIRSKTEHEEMVNRNPKYKMYNLWNTLITSIFKKDTNLGDELPYKTEMTKLLKARNIDFAAKDLDNALRVFTHLGVLKKKGNKKVINCTEEVARDVIRENLDIE